MSSHFGAAPSSRGQGHRPLTAKTRVRIPVGSLVAARLAAGFFVPPTQPTPKLSITPPRCPSPRPNAACPVRGGLACITELPRTHILLRASVNRGPVEQRLPDAALSGRAIAAGLPTFAFWGTLQFTPRWWLWSVGARRTASLLPRRRRRTPRPCRRTTCDRRTRPPPEPPASPPARGRGS